MLEFLRQRLGIAKQGRRESKEEAGPRPSLLLEGVQTELTDGAIARHIIHVVGNVDNLYSSQFGFQAEWEQHFLAIVPSEALRVLAEFFKNDSELVTPLLEDLDRMHIFNVRAAQIVLLEVSIRAIQGLPSEEQRPVIIALQDFLQRMGVLAPSEVFELDRWVYQDLYERVEKVLRRLGVSAEI